MGRATLKQKLQCYQSSKQSYNPFESISKVFLVFGINYDNPKSPSSLRRKFLSFQRKFVIFCWTVILFTLISYFLYSFKHESSKDFAKLRLAKVLQVLNSFILWCVLHQYTRSVSSAIQNVTTLGSFYRLKTGVNFIWMCLLFIPFFHCLFCFTVFYPFDAKRFNFMVQQFSFEMVAFRDESLFYLLLLPIFVNDGLIYMMPFCFTILYSVLCKHLKEIFMEFLKRLEHPVGAVTPKYVKRVFRDYNALMRVLDNFEQSMSLPIFLTSWTSIAGMFLGILILEDPQNHKNSYLPVVGIILISLLSLVTFMLTSCLASGINECDGRAKALMAQMTSTTVGLSLDTKISLVAVYNNPAFALSGWGFYRFKKSFILGAFGCILTYTLLITNL